jgi:hypothetical protein
MQSSSHLVKLFAAMMFLLTGAFGQQPPQQPAQPEKKPELITSSARLAAAKTAFVRKAAGSDIPFDVVSSSMEGWGHFTLVSTPEKADVIIEVSSPEEGGTSFSASGGPSRETGKMEHSSSATRQLSSGSDVRLIVRDAKTKVPLWSASERTKGSLKKVDRENNLVEATQRLVSKFHDQIEPPVSK